MGVKVRLGVILDAIEMADGNYTYFLDLETGEGEFLVDELITGLDNEGLEDEMEEFMWTLKGEKVDKLECAIRGRGGFGRFKDMVDKMGILQKWYAFQAEYYRNLAIAWCRNHRLGYLEGNI